MTLEQKSQFITIKGTREGLTLFVDDLCSFDDLLADLTEKIATVKPKQNEPIVPVVVDLKNRYLTKEQTDKIRQVVENGNCFQVQASHSAVIHKEEAKKWKEDQDLKTFEQIVRSGQVLHVKGDVFLIGDVNTGGKITSTGSIYILGILQGIAHAGVEGNKGAIIAASYMKPTQLRIADYISRAPDYESEGVFMECGFIDKEEDKIVIDRLQNIVVKRRYLKEPERRMQNG